MKQRLARYKLFLSALFLLTGVNPGLAGSWTNTSIGDWFLAPNWTQGVPTTGTLAVIDNGGTAFISAPNAASGDLWLGFNSFNQTPPGGNGTLLVGKAATGSAVGSYRAGHISIGRVFDNVPPSPLTGTLNISGGGVVEATTPTDQFGSGIVIGHHLYGGGPATGSVTVSGAGSRLSSQYGPIVLGLGNATGTLIVENGGNVQGPEGRIGIGSATVRGNGSVWYSYSSGLYVGSGGTPNASLDILTGGLVKTGLLKIYNGLVRVDNGSSTVTGLEISGFSTEISGGTNGQLVVGDTTAGRMVINNGGALIGFRGFLGGNPGGIGSALVTDPKSRWNASGSIWVGNSGDGTLDVLFGGTVTSTGNGYLAFSNNTTGYATIDGTKSAWTMAANLYIGGNGAAPGGNGQLVIRNGGTVTAAAATLWNTGILTLGANAALKGPLTAQGGALETTTNITFANNVTLETGGLFIRTNGFSSTFSGAISGSGPLTISGSFAKDGTGTLILAGNSTYSGPTSVLFGKLVVNGSIASPVTVNGNASLSGSGTVGGITIVSTGAVAPGNSAGKMTVNGNYTQQSGGVLNIEIGGPTPGTGFDQVAVSGSASVNGILNLSLVNGYRPTVGETFAIITSSSASGNFSTINSSGFTVRSDLGPGGVTLTVTSVVPGLPVITSSTTASGTQGEPFSYQITATESPTSFGATALPAGLSANTATGVISGTPTALGSSDTVISATNSTATGSATLNITISAPTPAPTRLANISTRLRVETDDNVLFGGFIITGTQPKKLIVRAIGPSSAVPGALDDPTLELYRGSTLLASNDNWTDSPEKQAIIDSTIPPTNDLESAIVRSLVPGSYTTIVRGVNQSTGVGVVEVYDLDGRVDSKLAQISTRGFVQTDDNVMIGGLYVVGGSSQEVIVRAIGPSLPLLGKLDDPTLELYDGNGTSLGANDNWRVGEQEAEIIATTVPPSDDVESAIVRTLLPGPYTAIVRGVNNATGIALVEVYALQ